MSKGSPGMSEVAQAAGVSMSTVSNVLNHPWKVKPQTRAKVEEAIVRLGFVRHGAARSLAGGTSSTIAFVAVDLGNTYFLDMARGAEQRAAEAGMNVVLANADLSAAKQQVYLNIFDEQRVAGIFLAPAQGSLGQVPPIQSHGRPVVVLNDPADGLDACVVVADDVHGGYLAARHLIEAGRRRLVFAGGPETLDAVRQRRAGVRRAVVEANGAVTLREVDTRGLRAEHGRAFAAELCDEDPGTRPDGVVAAADLLALGIVQVAVPLGARVPADLAVIGYDNNRAAWDSVVPISTIAQPGEQMGRAAVEILLEEVSGQPHDHRTVRLEPAVIARQSTAAD